MSVQIKFDCTNGEEGVIDFHDVFYNGAFLDVTKFSTSLLTYETQQISQPINNIIEVSNVLVATEFDTDPFHEVCMTSSSNYQPGVCDFGTLSSHSFVSGSVWHDHQLIR